MKSFLLIVTMLLIMPKKVQARRIHSFLIPNTIERDVPSVPTSDKKNKETKEVKHEIRPIHSLIHGVEVAEKVVVDAIRDEVETLFHDKDHEHKVTTDVSKKTFKPLPIRKVHNVSVKPSPVPSNPMEDFIHLNEFPFRPEIYGPDIRH